MPCCLLLYSICDGPGEREVDPRSPDWPEPAPSKEDCPGHTGEVMRCGCFLGTRFPPPTAPALPEAPG
ncbi:unnamed protein product [Rangifer tarandus platyrhynchus]|uniref:Uncharacterized protein n=1 Tax=Rangifer tarandus platyrhynchus TaxID=3082113 RepID=A0AC59ZAZ9_RANTA